MYLPRTLEPAILQAGRNDLPCGTVAAAHRRGAVHPRVADLIFSPETV